MNALPVKDTYSVLLKQIKQEIAEGLERAQKAYAREKVITYWKIGQAIAKHLSSNKGQADYGKQLYARLARDLEIGERLLYQVSQFYNTYPDLKPSSNLNWSHYRLLSSIKDKEQRDILEAKADNNNWSHRDLDGFIKDAREKDIKVVKPKKKKLSLFKGRLYTYRVFKDPCSENVLIDCGFTIYHESGLTSFRGSFVETVKSKNGYNLKKTNALKKHLYTYKAYVKKIIDGDTVWVMIDCGFKIWTHQKIRLRGINAPGITTQKGIKAYKFVCNELKKLPFIIIKSHGRDKYDRYLSDIFYLKGEENPLLVLDKGIFLNQRLLDERLAERSAT